MLQEVTAWPTGSRSIWSNTWIPTSGGQPGNLVNTYIQLGGECKLPKVVSSPAKTGVETFDNSFFLYLWKWLVD